MLTLSVRPLARAVVIAGCGLVLASGARAADPREADPLRSLQWPELKREFFGAARVVFDDRVVVRAPAFAEDPMNVPVSVDAAGLADIERIVVLVDRNPIRKVLEFEPLQARPMIAFRFKLEQASPVRAAARTRDGVWHVGTAQVDSAGGGCTVPGVTRKDGSWDRTLGQVSARLFASPSSSPASAAQLSPVAAAGANAALRMEGGARLRVRVMHPMDTGLVGGIPAFFINRLSLREASGAELLRLATFEPVSENPVFSFELNRAPREALTLSGSDNNGNRIRSRIEP
ncbi:quinoprotein dehydrogenase-associated SoxYZ-like carrier [Caldimonas tepidiphila]|uniref:quinoprotein dehydrogenase-associated SoxYZ-like carrier n=1 Tax=Caldimonas tepidiphila TaxID=2315841 RepID=UPI000E5C01A0|nr:quinoprotein dehydrogenase-associated SoxYZ-like carrier [Caldimonas tepidiphila]